MDNKNIDLSNFSNEELLNLQQKIWEQQKVNKENNKFKLLNGNKLKNVVGAPLDPQPPEENLDPCESWDKEGNITFIFFEGNEMDGHYKVFGPVAAPNIELEPDFNYDDKIWYWKQRETKSTYFWYKERNWL